MLSSFGLVWFIRHHFTRWLCVNNAVKWKMMHWKFQCGPARHITCCQNASCFNFAYSRYLLFALGRNSLTILFLLDWYLCVCVELNITGKELVPVTIASSSFFNFYITLYFIFQNVKKQCKNSLKMDDLFLNNEKLADDR